MKQKLYGNPLKKRTRDSSLAFFINQLTNLDRRLYEPLVDVTWSRDVKLRSGISFANESTSFMRSTFAGNGTLNMTGIPWLSANTTTIPGVSVNGELATLPLRLAGREISYTSVELDRSASLGQPIDVQQINALNTMYQMNIDQMVYIGDTSVNATGLVNSPLVTATNVPNGAGGSPLWANKTPQEILADLNALLTATWLSSAYAVMPKKVLLPPAQFARLASTLVSSAGNTSILTYLTDNNISNNINGGKLEIVPVKWLVGAGAGGTDRMVAYTDAEDRVRYPMVPIRRETPYYKGIHFLAPYIYLLGEMEVVYPETMRYADGI